MAATRARLDFLNSHPARSRRLLEGFPEVHLDDLLARAKEEADNDAEWDTFE